MDEVEDQSQTNSCCANAVCGAYEYMGKRNAMQGGTRKACFFADFPILLPYFTRFLAVTTA